MFENLSIQTISKAFVKMGGAIIGDQPYGVIQICNKTGSSIAAGKLVYISGFDATLGLPTITLADADTSSKIAQFVTKVAIANNAKGLVYEKQEIDDLNTNGASAVGDPVYLSTTAGGWSLSAPSGADQIVQIVGFVTVKSATVGKILFLLQPRNITVIGTSGIANDAITTGKIPSSTVIASDIVDDTVGLAKHIPDESHSIFVIRGTHDIGASEAKDTDLGALGFKGTLIAGFATVKEVLNGTDASCNVILSSAASGATPLAETVAWTKANQNNAKGGQMGFAPLDAGIDLASTAHIYAYTADDVGGDRSTGILEICLIFMKSA